MIQFIAEYNTEHKKNILEYLDDEYSFFMEGVNDRCDYEVILNKLSMCVIENVIVDLSGFCGLSKSMISDYNVPIYEKGILRVVNEIQNNYCINDDDWPIFINIKTGWVCIGEPLKTDKAIEFIDNCVAVISNEMIVALWLKPLSLPALK